MKTRLLLPFLFVSFFSFAQLTAIPDPEFERYLINMGFDTTNTEGIQDGFTETETLRYISYLYFFNNEFQIRDFTGIEDFTNLQEFVVTNGQIVHTLDISQNSQLVAFAIDGCRLDLDLSQNTNLSTIDILDSEIESLDLSNNLLLEALSLNNVKIKELDVSHLSNLKYLTLYDMVFLERIDLSISDFLYSPVEGSSFSIHNAPILKCIEVLDVGIAQSNVDAYKWQFGYVGDYSFSLNCDFDKIYIADENFEQALIDLAHDDVLDGFVLLSNIDDVTTLNLPNKNISDLTGINGFPSLQNLNVSANNLIELNLSANKSLLSLNASSNQLQTINVKNGNNSNFTSFNAINNPDLFCVKADDPSYSTSNWTQIDAQAAFGDNCIKAPLFFTRAPILPIEIEIFGSNYNTIETLPDGLHLDSQTGFLSGAPATELPPSSFSMNYQKNNLPQTAIIQMEVQKLEDYSVKSLQLRGFYSSDNGQFNINEFFVYSNGFNVSAYKNGSANSNHYGFNDWCENGIYPLIDGGRYSSDRNNTIISKTAPVIYTVEISQTEGYSIDDIFLDFGSDNGFLADFELYISEDNENWIRISGGEKVTTWTNNPAREYSREAYQPFTISSFTPENGEVGTEVVISGTNFDLVQKVLFQGVEVDYIIDSPTQITAIVNENVPTGFLEFELVSACDYLRRKSSTYFVNGEGVIFTEDNIWSNVEGAVDANIDVLIRGDLEAQGEFYAKNLILHPGGSIHFTNGTMKLSGNIINNVEDDHLTSEVNEQASAFILEDEANLIQTAAVNGNRGNITIKQKSRPIVRLDYTFWSSPVYGQQLHQFSPNTLPNRIYTYESHSSFGGEGYFETYPYSPFFHGRGYLFRAPNNWPNEPQPYEGMFIGTPNSGNIQVNTITYAGGYVSLGNPYPSNISPEDFLALNTHIYTLFFWNNPDRVFNETTQEWEYIGTKYVTFNQTGYSDPDLENKTISIGQGFIVRSLYNTFNFNNSIRTSNAEFFFKSGTERHRFWLNLTNEENTSYNKTLIGYMTGATNDADSQIDALHFGYEGSALYNLINDEKYTIQGRALPFENSDVVKLGFKAETAGKFNISLNNFDGLFAEGNVLIYLKDKLLNVTHNLMESNYAFESEIGEFNERFEIIYKEDETMNSEDLNLNLNVIQIYTNNDFIIVDSKKEKILSIELFDLSGKNIHSNHKVNANHYKMKLNFKGVVVVKVQTQNGEIKTKKIINK